MLMCLFRGILTCMLNFFACLSVIDSYDHFSFQAVEYDGKFFVSPGTATGAWTGLFNGSAFSLSLDWPFGLIYSIGNQRHRLLSWTYKDLLSSPMFIN